MNFLIIFQLQNLCDAILAAKFGQEVNLSDFTINLKYSATRVISPIHSLDGWLEVINLSICTLRGERVDMISVLHSMNEIDGLDAPYGD